MLKNLFNRTKFSRLGDRCLGFVHPSLYIQLLFYIYLIIIRQQMHKFFMFTNIVVGISRLLATDSIATKCMLECPYASFGLSQWCSHRFLVSGTWCFSAIRRNASGRFFAPMKRFGLYKPYVKLLHFRHKNTYEVFNTFTAIVDLSRFNNSWLKSPASTLVDLTFQSRALRSFSLNQLRNLSL